MNDTDEPLQLPLAYPHASGRDIKELLKLAARYVHRRGTPADLELFRKCAMFRGF